MTDQEQIDVLKAQVNCLRDALEQLARLGNGEQYGNSVGNTIAIKALEATPEYCLAEVKAKAIEDAVEATYDGFDGIQPFDLRFYANRLRGQVTVSDQLDLATKIMTVTI